MKVGYSLWMLFAVASCGPKQQPQQPVDNSSAPVLPEASAPPAVENNATAEAPANAAATQATLPEPNGPIDPKSVEAAGQVVQHYGALIEQGRWRQSWALWSNPDAARQFDRNWQADREVHLEIGKPESAEGAAGSIYVAMPVTFYGEDKKGADFRRPADVILRRVNDVPGSTEAQRRWHIERIEWK
jgi:hypothetical protein